jgi:hypothetical protein
LSGDSVKLLGSLVLVIVLSGCQSYSKRYYEPVGAGRLISPEYGDRGPGTELQIDLELVRSFRVSGFALEQGARVCVLIVPEQNVAIAVGASVIQQARLPTGEPLLAVANRVQVVFTPQEWNYPGSMPRSQPLPVEIVGERIAADKSFGSVDRYRGVNICFDVRTGADEFYVDVSDIVVNGTKVPPTSIMFKAKIGEFTRLPSAW